MSSDTTNRTARALRVVGLPGDGVGPEVYQSACQILAVMDELFDLPIELDLGEGRAHHAAGRNERIAVAAATLRS